MQVQVRIPTLPPVAPGLPGRPLNWPTTPSSGRVGARKRRLPARSSPAASSVSLFSLGIFFFHPCLLVSFSSWLRNPGQTAAFSNPSRPPGAQGASPLPRPAQRPERRPGPGPPTGGCSGAQPAFISRRGLLPNLADRRRCPARPVSGHCTAWLGRWRALLARSCWTRELVPESHPAGAPPTPGSDPNRNRLGPNPPCLSSQNLTLPGQPAVLRWPCHHGASASQPIRLPSLNIAAKGTHRPGFRPGGRGHRAGLRSQSSGLPASA